MGERERKITPLPSFSFFDFSLRQLHSRFVVVNTCFILKMTCILSSLGNLHPFFLFILFILFLLYYLGELSEYWSACTLVIQETTLVVCSSRYIYKGKGRNLKKIFFTTTTCDYITR